MQYEIQELVRNASSLACKPQLITRVESLLSNPMVAFTEIARAVSMDPTLAARTFKAANSCFFSRLTKAETLTEAIVTIGIKGLYSLVLIHTIKQHYFKHFGLQERSFWNHAVGVSIASVTLSIENGLCSIEDAMVCGLLHDIGKNLMNDTNPDRYANVTRKVYNERVSYSSAERELFGFTHTEVGFELAKQWSFPIDVQTVILHHHDLQMVNEEAAELRRLTSIVNLADTMCIKLGMSIQELDDGFSWEDVEATKILEFSKKRLDELEPVIRRRINEERMIFD